MSEATSSHALEEKIRARTAVVGVIGLGYVGLPLALLFEEAGFAVVGFDTDAEKPRALRRGESYIRHLGRERVAAAFSRGRITATSDFDGLAANWQHNREPLPDLLPVLSGGGRR